MAFVNSERSEITAKIVYYGPGLSGKTTCFHHIYRSLPAANKGKLLSLSTNVDRTIYFDFLPLKFENIQGLDLRMQLYTVPGQVRFNATRRMVLHDADGIVFVADMQKDMARANQDAMKGLFENLKELSLDLQAIPHVLQYNKEDLPNLLTLEELNANLNIYHAPAFVTCALSGKGVMDALKGITKLVVADIRKRKVIEQHLAQVAKEAEGTMAAAANAATAATAAVRTRPAAAEETDPAAMARRLIQAGLGAPTSRLSTVTNRPPSVDTIERNIREGAFEDVTTGMSGKGEVAVAAPEAAEEAEELEMPRDPLGSGIHPRTEKEIVVFSDKADALKSGIHRREPLPASPAPEPGPATEAEIEESLADLPDDEGEILDIPEAPPPRPSRVDETSKTATIPRTAGRRGGATGGLSMAPLCPDAGMRGRFAELESAIASAGLDGFGRSAASLLEELLADAGLFPDDGGRISAAAKMNLLGVKYARYLHFRATAERDPLPVEDALFCLHFLLDVALAKHELR